ncbi:sigma D regulator [Teredinibacter waterburyi]|uniref:sigma D regulator n=1 Tax=Teredinibacter waterburyi TaxID=1500538 RepID=UPI00165F7900|nr:sigma D regulator [Teredinibacter waterburyi]
MLEECQSAQERWGGVSEIIDRWLKERQQMLVLYCDLSDVVDDEQSQRGSILRSMCQIMVDYVSAGHFEVYGQLVDEGRAFEDEEGLATAAEQFKKVDSTTEYILDFNDKYQEVDDLEALPADLSRLGEMLAARFEAEDVAIKVLHVAHKDHLD